MDMDLERFFDKVSQSKWIEILSRTISDGRVISLIHKYLNAGVVIQGVFRERQMQIKTAQEIISQNESKTERANSKK